ncbi:hypothetical protein HanIR_Chr10g0465501 [Helianthus annuus]|nr:hypothetical protein HanIR_Chr10g0465501 [Helianthus annuus]
MELNHFETERLNELNLKFNVWNRKQTHFHAIFVSRKDNLLNYSTKFLCFCTLIV